MILLSPAEAARLLEGLRRGAEARASLDLGRSDAVVRLEAGAARLPDGQRLPLEELARIARSADAIFTVQGSAAAKLIRYSEATKRSYKLRPSADWPALEVSGVLMHRVKGTSPRADAEAKLRLAAPVLGSVLETCAGLGYTAILAARTAGSVTAIEKDENVLAMARINPWSAELFTCPRIRLVPGDAAEAVLAMPEGAFDLVNHDPPTLSVAGELYADAFYAQLLRVLRPGGRLLHYVGAPGSRSRGVDLAGSVGKRLARLGFRDVRADAATGCLLAARRGR